MCICVMSYNDNAAVVDVFCDGGAVVLVKNGLDVGSDYNGGREDDGVDKRGEAKSPTVYLKSGSNLAAC